MIFALPLLRSVKNQLGHIYMYAFNGTWGLFESGMVRPADKERTVMKKEVEPHGSLEIEGTLCHAQLHSEAPGLVRSQRRLGMRLIVVSMGRNR